MKQAYVISTIAVALFGILLCFVGPFSFLAQTPLLVPPAYTSGLSIEETQTIESQILRGLTIFNRHPLITSAMFFDLVQTRGIDLESTSPHQIPISEYSRVASALGVPRILSTSVYRNSRTGEVYTRIYLRTTDEGLTLASVEATAASFQDLEQGIFSQITAKDGQGRALPVPEDSGIFVLSGSLPHPPQGLSIFSLLVLGYFGLQIFLSLFLWRTDIFATSPLDGIRESLIQPELGFRARWRRRASSPGHPGLGEAARWNSSLSAAPNHPLLRRIRHSSPGDIIEALLAIGGLLLLFAWLYAENANMEYVRRFIAREGGVALGDTVAQARSYALVRFLPLLLLNLGAYAAIRFLPRVLPRVWRHRTLAQDRSRNPHRPMHWLNRLIYRGAGFIFRSVISLFRLPRPEHSRIESWLVGTSRAYSLEIAGIRKFWMWVGGYRLPLTLVSALLYALAFPNEFFLEGVGWVGWIALVPLFWVIKTSSFSQTLFYLTIFGAFQGVLVNSWHSTYGLIALPFVTIFSAWGFFVYALVMGVLRNLVYTPRVLGRHDWILWPLSWTLFDYVRSLGYAAYPWGFLGATQYRFSQLIQIADLSGIWGVTFLIVLVNSVISHIILPYPTRQTPWNSHLPGPITARRRFPALVTSILLLASLIYGQTKILQYAEAQKSTYPVLLVQQNTDPRKHEIYQTLQTLLALTEDQAPKPGTLVLWPEGALGFDISNQEPSQYPLGVRELQTLVQERQLYLVTGTNSRRETTELPTGEQLRFARETPVLEAMGYDWATTRRPHFNSVVSFLPTGERGTYYEKIRLVPFSEYFPYKQELPWMYRLLDHFNSSDWTPGWEHTLFPTPAGLLATPVCFEDVFPNHLRRFVLEGAELFGVVSNDYWSLTPVEGQQHAVHALFRSVENRIPMVRATTSGLTSVINPLGTIEQSLDYYVEGTLPYDLPILEAGSPFKPGQTLYTRWGDWFPLVAGGIFLVILLWVLLFRTVELLDAED